MLEFKVMTWQQQLDAAIDARAQQMVTIRRHIHAHPEVSGQEHETSLYLYQLLMDEGFEVRMGPDGRGLMVDPREEPRRPKFALRADIDALRIQDEKDVEYRSCREGIMHACGHDAHTSILYGALCGLRDAGLAGKLPWEVNVRGIFQPSEETATGAAEMVGAGALDGVRAILAAHVDPTRATGHIGTRSGVLTANCDTMRIMIVGRGGHAARPHETIDPIATAAQLINSIYLTVPRATDSQDAVVITIGQITGGANPNVIPEQVELLGTLRTLEFAVRNRTMEHIEQICRGVAQSSGTRIVLTFESGIHSVRNDPELSDLVRRVGGDVLGTQNVEEIPRASMGSEDFAVYLDHVPGAMFRLGCAPPGGNGAALHTPKFDVAETSLVVGAKIMARTVVAWSEPGSASQQAPGTLEKSR